MLRRLGKQYEKGFKTIPDVINEYNQRMNNVDRSMSSVAQFPWPHKCNKWTLAALMALILCVLHNVKVILAVHSNTKKTQVQHLTRMVDDIIDAYGWKNEKIGGHAMKSSHHQKKIPCAHCGGRTMLRCSCGKAMHKNCFSQHVQSVAEATRSPKPKKEKRRRTK